MLNTVGKVLVAAGLAGAFMAGAAIASPTCTTTNVLPSNGLGTVSRSAITAGYCVRIQDKVFGNFNLGNLPSNTVVIFSVNSVLANDNYGIAFSGTYDNNHGAGRTYNWSYEVAVTGAPPGTKIVELDADYTQTAGGPSTLDEDITQGGVSAIHEVKTGPLASGTTQYIFNPGITDLQVAVHLFDKGTISSVFNTIVQFVPSRNNVPEPLTLSLFGAGLAGLGMARRKRRN